MQVLLDGEEVLVRAALQDKAVVTFSNGGKRGEAFGTAIDFIELAPGLPQVKSSVEQILTSKLYEIAEVYKLAGHWFVLTKYDGNTFLAYPERLDIYHNNDILDAAKAKLHPLWPWQLFKGSFGFWPTGAILLFVVALLMWKFQQSAIDAPPGINIFLIGIWLVALLFGLCLLIGQPITEKLRQNKIRKALVSKSGFR